MDMNPLQRNALEKKIENLFLRLCVPTHLKGFAYLRSAVYHALCEESGMPSIPSNHLCGTIAEEYSTTPAGVERNVRTALRKIPLFKCEQILSRSPLVSKGVTFKEFVHLCVKALRTE